MPFDLLVEESAVLPLRAVAFQSLLLLVAIALEAGLLRQRLGFGFQPSIRYAATLNLFTTCLGWLLFLGIEPLAPAPLRTQIISYVLFGRFYDNELLPSLGPLLVGTGLGIFFLTFWLKAKGLEWLTFMVGQPIVDASAAKLPGRKRFGDLQRQTDVNTPAHTLAMLHANALSFSVILLLLLLRYGLEVSA